MSDKMMRIAGRDYNAGVAIALALASNGQLAGLQQLSDKLIKGGELQGFLETFQDLTGYTEKDVTGPGISPYFSIVEDSTAIGGTYITNNGQAMTYIITTEGYAHNSIRYRARVPETVGTGEMNYAFGKYGEDINSLRLISPILKRTGTPGFKLGCILLVEGFMSAVTRESVDEIAQGFINPGDTYDILTNVSYPDSVTIEVEISLIVDGLTHKETFTFVNDDGMGGTIFDPLNWAKVVQGTQSGVLYANGEPTIIEAYSLAEKDAPAFEDRDIYTVLNGMLNVLQQIEQKEAPAVEREEPKTQGKLGGPFDGVLPNHSCVGVLLQAESNNLGSIYYGKYSGEDMQELVPGASQYIPCTNINQLWVKGTIDNNLRYLVMGVAN